MSIDDLTDRVRALESELTRERGHRESAEAYADACDALLRSLLAPVGWSGAERRQRVPLANWTGVDRRRAAR